MQSRCMLRNVRLKASRAADRLDEVYDISAHAPTMTSLLERDDAVQRVRQAPGQRIGLLDELLTNTASGRCASKVHLLARCDLQVVKAAGVTFATSLLERVIEERSGGDPRKAEAIRGDVERAIGGDLRDFEGRSALLLGKAKDNNASCAVGPFIRLLDKTFTLDDLRRKDIELMVEGCDGFVLRGASRMHEISRDPLDLVAQTFGPNHQYPDGFMLFLGTLFAPVQDRGAAGQGFTHQIGDVVTIRSGKLEYLDLAEQLAAYYVKRLEGRGIPPYDFDATGEDAKILDSAAGAVVASALIEMGRIHPDRKAGQQWGERGIQMLEALCREAFAAEDSHRGALKHACYSRPHMEGVDSATMFGDYFFVEALCRVVLPGRFLQSVDQHR